MTLTLEVTARDEGADGVSVLTLQRPDRSDLPCWEPGAHIDLLLRPGLIRQYSLSGSTQQSDRWRIAVQLDPHSRGGSQFVHDELHPDTKIEVRGPRNNFALAPARRYIFIAGGIGITPILPMLAAAQTSGAEAELHYGGRSRVSMAFLDDLRDHSAIPIALYPQDEVGLIDLAPILGSPTPDTLVYACGPAPMLAAVETYCAAWPTGTLRLERFTPRSVDPVESKPENAFEVELAASGTTLAVPPDQSILDVIEQSGVHVDYSCREGTCGTCETSVLAGEIDHRDSLLSPEEQAANDVMFICVSRAASHRIVLDL
ncbi:oxidoreductase [Pseudonocardia sp. ICBG1122]|nr:oxidoreductase [Pseudonocardia pini]